MNNQDLNNENNDEVTYVLTRSGIREVLDMNQITIRLKKLVAKEPKIPHVNPYDLSIKVVSSVFPEGNKERKIVSTSEIDEEAAHIAANLGTSNPYYMVLAGRIAVDNHQKNTSSSFYVKMKLAKNNKDENGDSFSLLNDSFYSFVEKYCFEIEQMIDYSRDFLLDYFGIRMLQKSYSLKVDDKPIERPQDVFMREAIQVSRIPDDGDISSVLEEIKETYDLLSNKLYTHGSPTCYNSGGRKQQLASCYLLGNGDSIEEIEKGGTNMSYISKWAGGIGMWVHSWRGTGSVIRGTNGKSSGIVPFLRTYETRLHAFNQGGRRPGSGAMYLMPHHPDILDFIDISRNTGEEKMRARDLFTAIWIPDIFMERVKSNQTWSLIDPKTLDLSQYHGDEYRKHYLRLEEEKKYVRQLPARQIWESIYQVKKLRGFPYICFADNANKANNHSHIGTVRSSNLCSEIYLYSDTDEYAVCVLASIALPNFVMDGYSEEELKQPDEKRRTLNHEFPVNPWFDYEKLIKVSKVVARNLNNVVDRTYIPVEEAKRGNERHRPIGIGIQGLDDAYSKMRYPFDSKDSLDLNKKIFECIYYSSLCESSRLCRKEYTDLVKNCKENGYVDVKTFKRDDYYNHYITYTNPTEIPKKIAAFPSMLWGDGSPIGKGVFHWEMVGLKPEFLSGMFDWESLREHIQMFGVKNSHVVALMPTASTSQLLGNNECFEPYTSNIYTRDTLAGKYTVIKKYLINDLFNLKLWNDDMKDLLMAEEGSVQNIGIIPKEIRDLYKTAFEIDSKVLLQQAIDRQPFVDQGMSQNGFSKAFSLTQFTSDMFMAWRGGLKTGSYYQHTEAAIMPQKFTVDPRIIEKYKNNTEKENILLHGKAVYNTLENVCESCSG